MRKCWESLRALTTQNSHHWACQETCFECVYFFPVITDWSSQNYNFLSLSLRSLRFPICHKICTQLRFSLHSLNQGICSSSVRNEKQKTKPNYRATHCLVSNIFFRTKRIVFRLPGEFPLLLGGEQSFHPGSLTWEVRICACLCGHWANIVFLGAWKVLSKLFF